MDELRELVATGCRVLGTADQGDLVGGHLSARDPEDRGVWMKASTFGFEEITAERVVLVVGMVRSWMVRVVGMPSIRYTPN